MRPSAENSPGTERTRSRMTAAVLDRFGGVEELKLRSVPIPDVRDDDVLIRVEVAGVASWDAVERQGQYDGVFGIPSTFPYVLGWDAAGTVAAVGRNVTRFEIGDRVYAATMPAERGGCYAEFAVVEAEFVAHVPERLPTERAGVMAWDALTALSGSVLVRTPSSTGGGTTWWRRPPNSLRADLTELWSRSAARRRSVL